MKTEADIFLRFVVPKLQAAGWDNEPYFIAEQRSFTDGGIVVHGNKAARRPGKRADYLLRYTCDFPIAAAEAKSEDPESKLAENSLSSEERSRKYCFDGGKIEIANDGKQLAA